MKKISTLNVKKISTLNVKSDRSGKREKKSTLNVKSGRSGKCEKIYAKCEKKSLVSCMTSQMVSLDNLVSCFFRHFRVSGCQHFKS